MQIRKCILKGASITSLDELYDALAKGLKLPGHFGRNLDALRDVLTTDIEGPIEIVWKDADQSKKLLKKDYGKIVAVLREAAAERDDLTITIL
jgi:ribonuclease inhibitor